MPQVSTMTEIVVFTTRGFRSRARTIEELVPKRRLLHSVPSEPARPVPSPDRPERPEHEPIKGPGGLPPPWVLKMHRPNLSLISSPKHCRKTHGIVIVSSPLTFTLL